MSEALRWPADREQIERLLAECDNATFRERAGVSENTTYRWRRLSGVRPPAAAAPSAPPSIAADTTPPEAPQGDHDARARAARAAAAGAPEPKVSEPRRETTPSKPPALAFTPELIVALSETLVSTSVRGAALLARVPQTDVTDLAQLEKDDRTVLREHAGLVMPWLEQAGSLSPGWGAAAYGVILLCVAAPRVHGVRMLKNARTATLEAEAAGADAPTDPDAPPEPREPAVNGAPTRRGLEYLRRHHGVKK